VSGTANTAAGVISGPPTVSTPSVTAPGGTVLGTGH
jgi:hypothetical protein